MSDAEPATAPVLPADPRPTIAIVGAGASGTLTAAQLLRRHHPGGLRLLLIERRGSFGRGVAYSTPWDYHRLNVPVEQMGALPRDPRHFLRWASRRGEGLVVGDFAPRGLFGDYLGELLAEAERAADRTSTLERIEGNVIGLTVDDGGARPTATVRMQSGEMVLADRVVLALGNLPPADPPGSDAELLASGHYEPDPWDPGLPDRTCDDREILLLGTGLTMVDVALTLGSENFSALLHAVSRKGLMPQAHRRGGLAPRRFALRQERVRLDELVRRVGEEIAEAEGGGGNWRQVIDSMRPVTNQIWHRLREVDQGRFVRQLARRWDVHRHRMAPEVGGKLELLRSSGRLRLGQGSIEGMQLRGERVEVTIAHEEGETELLLVDRVVNCTGPALDLRETREPLLDSLFGSGRLRQGPLHLGLDHDMRGALLDGEGRASRVLHTLGPMRKGRLWETTAIPEIRTQAFELADELTAGLQRTTASGATAVAPAQAA
jgi:uncharacterized NAD(P)/FAD-binding protein YdhS